MKILKNFVITIYIQNKRIFLWKKLNSDFSYPFPVFHENIKEIELSIVTTICSMLKNRRS